LMLVRLANEAGRLSDWSNEARLRVVPPLPPPQQLQAELVPEGIRLSWQGHPGREGVRYRVFRAGSDPAAGFAEAAVIDVPEWIDTTAVPGETYRYEVDAIIDTEGAQAVSARTPTAAIRMEDRFPPSPPSGLRAVPGLDSVELTWEAGTEPDLAGYHVYRAEPTGALQRIAETVQGLNYSDSAVESGTVYLYTVTAIDLAGNESAQPDPVEIAAP
jgi:fibronectin type 3 domain-containing protein